MPGVAVPKELVAGTDDVAISGPCVLYGYALRESAAVAAVASVIIRNGTDATGAIVLPIELAGDAFDWAYFAGGIRCGEGVFVERVAGSTEGSIFIG